MSVLAHARTHACGRKGRARQHQRLGKEGSSLPFLPLLSSCAKVLRKSSVKRMDGGLGAARVQRGVNWEERDAACAVSPLRHGWE